MSSSGNHNAVSSDPYIGQRFFSALTDLAFFTLIGVLAIKKVIGETLIGTLLSSYAAYRFGNAQGKQQAVTALANSGAFPPQGPGSSGPTRAVRADRTTVPVTETPEREDETFAKRDSLLGHLAAGGR